MQDWVLLFGANVTMSDLAVVLTAMGGKRIAGSTQWWVGSHLPEGGFWLWLWLTRLHRLWRWS